MPTTAQPTPGRAHVYDYAVRVTEIATETLRLSPEAAAAAFADPEHPTPAEIEVARGAAADAGVDLNRRWHDVESERVNPDSIEVAAVLGRPRT